MSSLDKIARPVNSMPTAAKLMFLVGILALVPLVCLIAFPREMVYAPSFLAAAGISCAAAVLVCLLARKTPATTWRSTLTGSSLTVLFIWIWGPLISAIPFWLGLKLTPLHALFESISGWSTTGLSVIDVSATPEVFMFHRCFMQYCGAMGFVLMLILVISNRESMNLYDAEGHPDKILPSLPHTARAIFFIYNVCLVLGTVAYMVAGLTFFDALYHAMCALSTGGFSNKVGSIGDFNNVAVEAITIVLMLIGSINFATLILMAQGKVLRALKTSEVLFMAAVVVIACGLMTLTLVIQGGMQVSQGLRQGIFAAVTAMSTCGFSISNYGAWPPLALGVMVVVMFVGGGLGSTSGGLKLRRAMIGLKVMMSELKRRISPRSRVSAITYTTAQGPQEVDAAQVANTMGMFMVYLVTFMVGTVALCLTSGFDLGSCMFEFASALSGVGLSVGITSATANAATLIIEMIAMLIGRLEIVIVFVAIGTSAASIKDWLLARARK